MCKIIFITGGVISGLGKGIVTASLSNLLINLGYKINITKFDPYLNYSAKYLSPSEHGEVFVTEDGGEVDLDLGHYQRFTGLSLTKDNCITSGRILSNLIDEGKRGEMGGKTLQFIPHFTDAITQLFESSMKGYDYSLIEIGGTVGDMESYPYLHAISRMNQDDYKVVNLVYVVDNNGEFKTKPAQNSIKELRGLGINPDVLICRSHRPLDKKPLLKISKSINFNWDNIISLHDVDNIYTIPSLLKEYPKLISTLTGKNDLPDGEDKIFPLTVRDYGRYLNIGIVGKYTENTDAYLSVIEAIKHASNLCRVNPNIDLISSENISDNGLTAYDGIVIPGGFGTRGYEGKLEALRLCRENDVPTLGICLGMQLMYMEFVQNVLKIPCYSEEGFGNGDFQLISSVREDNKMLVGNYRTSDGLEHIFRNRFGVRLVPTSEVLLRGIFWMNDYDIPSVIENPEASFYRGTQYHPEFKSNYNEPSKDFVDLITSSIRGYSA